MSSNEKQMKISYEHEKGGTDSECGRDWEYAMQLASASVMPMVLKAAIELGLLDILSTAGPGGLLSSSEIASRLPNYNSGNPIMLDRMLRLLASYSILTCSVQNTHHNHHREVDRLYGLAHVAKYFVPNQDQSPGVSLAPLLNLIQDKVMIDMWYNMEEAVVEGGLPFNRTYGMNASEYIMKNDPRLLETFKTSMRDYNHIFMTHILETYKEGFQGLKSIVDVGGGDGTILNMIVSNYPTIQGINFDLPHVIQNSPSYPGIVHVAGDMFECIPKGEAIFMKWILHGWDDEHCLNLLKNCYEALPDHGKAIIVELVVPEFPETSTSARSIFQFDLFMMNMNPGGKERTEKEFQRLAKEVGFCGIKTVCCAYNFSLVEFYKTM